MTAVTELSARGFLLGAGALLGVVFVLGWGAWRLRVRLLPDWVGPPARLVETLLVLLGVTASGEILGAADALRGGPLAALCVVVGVGMAVIGRPSGKTPQQLGFPMRITPQNAEPRREVIAATLGIAVVAAQWVSHTAHAVHRGMLQPDTLAYHGPFAARFLQDGTFANLAGLDGETHRFTPQNSELLHAVAAVPFHRDLLSPLLNLGWAALVVLGAWSIGRRRGVGALCVLGVAVVLGLPSLSVTQPGQASTDVVCAALVVTAAALLLEPPMRPTTVALAGAAAGLAIGTKLSLAVPILILTVGVLVLSRRLQRSALAASWCAALLLAGGYWYLRDWILDGSPVPFLNISIGPISLRGSAPVPGESAAHYFTNGTVWDKHYLPGLLQAFGPAWPLIVGLGVVGAVLAAFRRGPPTERLIGLAAFVGICAYPITPVTGALGGRSFVYDLRFLASVLLLVFILLPLSLSQAPRRWRWGTCLVLLGLALVGTATGGIPGEPMPAWPADGVVAGVVAGIVVIAAVAVFSMRGAVTGSVPGSPALRLAAASVVVVIIALAGGWFLQRSYLDDRYARIRLYVPFRQIHNATVAVFGISSYATYPMFGADFSNHVIRPTGPTQGTNRQLCQDWKQLLSGRYRYVVLGHRGLLIGQPDFIPSNSWFFDPAVTTIAYGRNFKMFRLDGELNTALCRPRRVVRNPKRKV